MVRPRSETLVGRAAEKAVLKECVDAVAAGRGGALWIEGPPDLGKSALVDLLAGRSARAGLPVLRGSARQPGAPLRLLRDCLDLPEPADEGRSAPKDTATAVERLIALVEEHCARGPAVLLAEDLHWADEPSLLVWNQLARFTVDRLPLLLVATARLAPRPAAVRRLHDLVRDREGQGRGGRVLPLGPLDEPAVAELAARAVGAPPGPRLRAELARAGGAPVYVRELVGALTKADLIEVRDATAEFRGEPGATARLLAEAVRRHLGFLTGPTLAVLGIAALLDSEFELRQLAAAARLPPVQTGWAMAEALDAGVLKESGRRLAFSQPLVRQVLRQPPDGADPDEARRAVARALAEAGHDLDPVARQLLALTGEFDGWAVDWLYQADESAFATARLDTAELLRRALCAVPESDPRWERLAVRQVQAAFRFGRDDEVAEVAAQITARGGDTVTSAQAATFAIRAAGRSGDPAGALAAADAAMARPGLPPAWQARLTAWSAVALTEAGQRAEAEAAAVRALAQAKESQDPPAIAYGYHALSLCTDKATAVEHATSALEALGTDVESRDIYIMVLCNKLIWLDLLGRSEEYRAQLRNAAAAGYTAGVRGRAIRAVEAEVAYLHGDWDEALEHLREIGLADAGDGRRHGSGDPYGTDHPDALDRGLDPATTRARGLSALIALHRGEQASALTPTDTAAPGRTAAHCGRPRSGGYLALARAVAIEVAQAAEATATAQTAEPAQQNGAPSGGGPHGEAPSQATVAEARLRGVRLDCDSAELLHSATQCRDRYWPLLSGFLFEQAAVRLAAAGETAAARKALGNAVHAYAVPGALWDIHRADARLRALGIRRGPRSTPNRQTTGWSALTAAERRVARLVAEGSANADIATRLVLSQRTVEAYVSSILAKLGLRSRVEVVRAAEQAEAAPANPPRRSRTR